MPFPLFRRPGAVVMLDDDPDYLDMMGLILPAHWQVDLFLRPRACVDHLQAETPRWEADAQHLQDMVDRWHEGTSLISQLLDYWDSRMDRYALTRVSIFDYSMPGMNGMEALAELGEWPGLRVLLTGQADEQLAVKAFNRGLIDQFIPKQSTDVSKVLVTTVQDLLDTPHPRHTQIWQSSLTPEQKALLRRPSVVRDLTAHTQRWLDLVVLGAPFGILGMDVTGAISWLQLEPTSGLESLAELASSLGLAASDAAAIRSGRALADLELQQAIGEGGHARLSKTQPVGHEGDLVGASFTLDCPPERRRRRSYASWLETQGPRTVRD